MVAHGLMPIIPTLRRRRKKDQKFKATRDCRKNKNEQKAKRGSGEPLCSLCKAAGLNNSKMFASGFFPNEARVLSGATSHLTGNNLALLGSCKGMTGIWGLSFSLWLGRLCFALVLFCFRGTVSLVAKAALKVMITMHRPPKCWGYRQAPHYLVIEGKELMPIQLIGLRNQQAPGGGSEVGPDLIRASFMRCCNRTRTSG